jgi:hypothetical protein
MTSSKVALLSPSNNVPIGSTSATQQYVSSCHQDPDDDSPLLLTDAIHPNKYKMKQQRRDATAICVVGGAVVGTIILPVLGTAVGGAAAGYACNKLSKRGEQRLQRKWEQSSFQRQATLSHTVNAEYV